MEEESTASEEKDVEEGNDPMIKESENEKTEKQSDEVPEEWKGVVFGESTSASRYAIEPLEDGVRLSSTNNGGKFQSSGSDGMTYYYQAIPKDTNFRMRATIEIESWTYTNAQEGFALMVRDTVPKDHLFGQAFYSNSFAILAVGSNMSGTRIDKKWSARTAANIRCDLDWGHGQSQEYHLKILKPRLLLGVSQWKQRL